MCRRDYYFVRADGCAGGGGEDGKATVFGKVYTSK